MKTEVDILKCIATIQIEIDEFLEKETYLDKSDYVKKVIDTHNARIGALLWVLRP